MKRDLQRFKLLSKPSDQGRKMVSSLKDKYQTGDFLNIAGGHILQVQNVYDEYLNGLVVSLTSAQELGSSYRKNGLPRVYDYEIVGKASTEELAALHKDIASFVQSILRTKDQSLSWYPYVLDYRERSESFLRGFQEQCTYALSIEKITPVNPYDVSSPDYSAYDYGMVCADKITKMMF